MLAESQAGDEGTYLLEQTFRYTYASPVRRLRNRLMVVPRAVHGPQRLFDHGLTVSGNPVLVSTSSDTFGNQVVELRAAAVAEWIEFDTWALVGWRAPCATTTVPAPAFDDRLLAPSALTRPDAAISDAAAQLRSAGSGELDLAERACTWTHRALTYEHGVTGVRTPAAAALAGGRGVCQDYAHVMVALCRAAGVRARYVSGHLVGEGGSHAWAEVVVADPTAGDAGRAVAVAFDPTHDRQAGRGYLTVAVGRDYADVAPTSGTFEGAGPGVLSARKRLSVVATEAATVAAGSL
ncbi:MAG TPA: transglutaminase family protein [Acidimicrobiales bacterium]|nr:transglutaminase family protein [Acidimicrobiales bacterium]